MQPDIKRFGSKSVHENFGEPSRGLNKPMRIYGPRNKIYLKEDYMKNKSRSARAAGQTLEGGLSRPIDRRTLLKGALAATAPGFICGPRARPSPG